MTTSTNPTWPVGRSGQANREVTWSGRLAKLANEVAADGFPFTAEHLRHLAGYVLDEAATKYADRPSDGGSDGLGPG